jgi:rhodanese-related sulfurtransferase
MRPCSVEPSTSCPPPPATVVCREGYSSSLAVASLLDLGPHRATDVIGGADAWREAGLPLEPMP